MKYELAAALVAIVVFPTSAFTYSGGTGTPLDPYQIASPADWQMLVTRTDDSDKSFVLTADIDLSGIASVSVQSFTGTFDGIGHTIRNVEINKSGTDYVGLFTSIGGACQIRNVQLEGISVVGRTYVGALVGYSASATASISNCHANGEVTVGVGATTATGYGKGGYAGGGLIGGSRGIITHCSTSGTVSGMPSSFYVGGLVGLNEGKVTDCHSVAQVTCGGYTADIGGLIGCSNYGITSRCFAVGSVIADDLSIAVGGLTGDHSDGSIEESFATGTVQGGFWVGGLVGHLGTSADLPVQTEPMGTAEAIGSSGTAYGISDRFTARNCYATGAIHAISDAGGLVGGDEFALVGNCYSVGPVNGGGYTGGFIGYNWGWGAIGNCWDIETSGWRNGCGISYLNTSATIVGRTTSEMKTLATFVSAGWDFVSVWTIRDGMDYPRLRWEVPTAEAGPDQAIYVHHASTATVTLDGSLSSDVLDKPITFQWSADINGHPFTSSDANPVIYLSAGKYVFYLVVNNGVRDSAPDTCIVTVVENQLPIADAGSDRTIYADHTGKVNVTLNGAASSDPEGQALTYRWTWTLAGKDCNSTDPNFTVELPIGTHVFTLIVNDGMDESVADSCTITVVAPLRASLLLSPRAINGKSHGGPVTAIMTIPGITKSQLDPTAPLTLWPFDVQAKYKFVFNVNIRGQQYMGILAQFDRHAIIAATPTGKYVTMQVGTRLSSGRYVVGQSGIFIFYPPKAKR